MGFWYDLLVPGALSASIQKRLETPEAQAIIKTRTFPETVVSNFTGAAGYVGEGVKTAITGAAGLAGSTAMAFIKPLVPIIVIGLVVIIASNVISRKLIKG